MKRLLLGLILTMCACGGSNKPAESANEKKSADDAADPNTSGEATAKKAAPKPESKYPEPFLEPDCSTVPTDGYLPNAKVVIADVRKKHWDRLKACADAAGEEHVSGEIRTTFRLDPDGIPRCVEAPGAAVTNKEVVNCVVAVYRSFRFPAPKNGSVRVTDGIKFDTTVEDED
jgi:hypothetical protein